MNPRYLLLALIAALALAACGDSGGAEESPATVAEDPSAQTETQTEEAPPEVTGALAKKPKVAKQSGAPPKKLETKDLIVGKGQTAKSGDTVSMQYVGVLYDGGKEFDASWNQGEPFNFTLGGGEVIPGWDEGIVGMKVGGRRQLTIPPEKGYGEQGSPPDIPPNAALVFVVDLIDVQ